MNLVKSIKVFQQVVSDESFSVAAEKLNLVPSAVSRQINELEKWLGVRLFNRTTRSINLTDEGRNLLGKMTTIIHQVEELKAQGTAKQELDGSVKITAPVMLGQHEMPRIIAAFKAMHPKVKVSLTLMQRKVDLIEEGFDIAIRGGKLADSNLHAKTVSEINFKTVATQDYLTRSCALLHPKDLSSHNCIVNNSVSKAKRWLYKLQGKEQHFKIDGDTDANDSWCILQLALADVGIARLPIQYVEQHIKSGDLVEVLSEFQPSPLPISIIFPSNRLISPTQRALIDFISAKFNQERG